MRIIWKRHAEERQEEWRKKLGITRQEVENALSAPEQVVPGDLGAWVAQVRRGEGLLRVVFVESEGAYKMLTVYWTSKVEKYWREE